VTPAEAFTGVLDLQSKAGMSIYKEATRSLYEDANERFDCDPEHLHTFLTKLEDHGMEFAWASELGILWIPTGVKKVDGKDEFSDETTYLLENYGAVSHEGVFRWEKSFINTQSRAAQDSQMLARCIMKSLSAKGQNKIHVWKNHYRHNGRNCGVTLLKVVIRESAVDTEATSLSIQRDLRRLSTYIVSANSDISQVNMYVRTQLEALRARGEDTTNIEKGVFVDLLDAYACASDNAFCDYIKNLENGHEDGTKRLTLSSLMQLAANKYKNLVQLKKWNAPTAQDEKFLALSTTVAKLSQETKKRKDAPKSHSSSDKKPNKKPDWLFKHIPPPANQMTATRTWNDQTYRWCSKASGGKCKGKGGKGAWRTHKPEECEGDGNRQTTGNFKSKPTGRIKKEKSKGKLQLSKSLQAMAARAEDSDSS
jgi:hypothetical protein